MIRMRVGRVVVIMVVVMIVVVPVIMMPMMVVMPMPMIVMMVIGHFESAKPGAEIFTECAIDHIRAGCRGALAFDVVVVAFLNGTDFAFEAEHFGAVLAGHAIMRRYAAGCRVLARFGRDELWRVTLDL